MKRKIEERALANLLKKADLKSPSQNLTHLIMEQLELEAMEMSQEDQALSSMLKKAVINKADDGLKSSILSKLEPKKAITSSYRPLVDNKVKLVYGLLMCLGIIYLLFNTSATFTFSIDKLVYIGENFGSAFIACTSIIILLFLDVFIRNIPYYDLN